MVVPITWIFAGGVEQLERQFGGGRGEEEEVVVPERPNISKSLYERVLSGRARISNSGGAPPPVVERDRSSDRWVLHIERETLFIYVYS